MTPFFTVRVVLGKLLYISELVIIMTSLQGILQKCLPSTLWSLSKGVNGIIIIIILSLLSYYLLPCLLQQSIPCITIIKIYKLGGRLLGKEGA